MYQWKIAMKTYPTLPQMKKIKDCKAEMKIYNSLTNNFKILKGKSSRPAA